jgi:hypothetical protein
MVVCGVAIPSWSAAGEDVVVEGRQRYHGQDLACFHVHHGRRRVLGAGGVLLQRLGDLGLEIEVDAQHQARPVHRTPLRDRVQLAAGGVHFYQLLAGLAPQEIFVT